MSQRWKNRSHAEVAIAFPHALLVAFLAALPAAAAEIPKDERWCLLWAGTGCSSITTEELCLGSRDGRNWKGSPCAWCGGAQCTAERCQAVDQAKGMNATLTPATCSNRTVEESEMGDPVLKRGALFVPVHTPGQPNIGQACRHNTITDKKESYFWIFSASSLDRCKDRCRSYDDCTGIQYNPTDESCQVWWKPIHWSMASKGDLCLKVAASDLPGKLQKPRSTYCLGLTLFIDGCTGIEDEHLCLNSRDGRKEGLINGSRIYGEPCVWCGGQACTSLNDNRCEPYDWLLQHTNDLAFSPRSSHFPNISIASCDEDTSASSTTMDLVPPLPAEVATLPPEVSVEFDSNATTGEPAAAIGALTREEGLGSGSSFQFPWWGWVIALLAVCAVLAALVCMFFRSERNHKPKARKKTRAIRQLEAESTDEITPMLEEASPADKDAAAMDTEGPLERPPPAFPALQQPLYHQPSLFQPPPLSMHAGRGVGMLAGTHLQQPYQQQRYTPLSVVEMPMARGITPLHRLPPPMRAPAGAVQLF